MLELVGGFAALGVADRRHDLRLREPTGITQLYEPVAEDAIGVARREFFNRGLLTLAAFSLAGTGSALLGFGHDTITIDTEAVILGPPVGTNTTGQNAAGPLCV